MSETEKTDWTRYYRKPAVTARLLRRITASRLISGLERSGSAPGAGGFIVEPGGGGSSFARRLARRFGCAEYGVLDTHEEGLELFRRQDLPCHSRAERCDILGPLPDWQGDLVFSAGLIEHFPPEETARAVRAHFELAKEGGTVAFLFPENTGLYRTVRRILEVSGLWHFPDERALEPPEVIRAAGREPLLSEGIRIILLTQRLLVFRKEKNGEKI